MTSASFILRPLTAADRDWVRQKTVESWEAEIVIAHNETFRPAELPGFAAFIGEEVVGLLTYCIKGNAFEVVTLDSWREGIGVGSALIEAAGQVARQTGCGRLFLITTNNNLHALRFYQKRGFVISAIHINAITESRKLKPEIPMVDEDGVPIRDEIELEILL
jgi:ribosomal protein S18 acetylase RimI-like enzyme